MDAIMSFLGLQHVGGAAGWFILALGFTAAIISGWLADAIMEGLSFGIIMNSILLTAGAVLTLIVWRYFQMPFYREYGYAFMVAVPFGAFCFLLLCGIARRFG